MISNIILNAKKSSAASGGDPYFSAVSLLLPMDGSGGSTTFTDASSNAITLTATGSPQISTSQSKFGGASLYLNGSSYLQATLPSGSLNFGTGDFTVECWIYRIGNTGEGVYLSSDLIDMRSPDTANVGWELELTRYGGKATPYVAFGTSGANYALGTTLLNNSQWYHIAATRSGSAYRIFINGSLEATGTNSSLNATNTLIRIGYGAQGYFNGYIDDLRISKLARYTSAFTPPTSAFPNS